MANQASISTADSLRNMIVLCHNKMVVRLSRHFSPKLKDKWEELLQLLQTYLEPVDLYGDDNSFMKICNKLMALQTIDYGSYDALYELMKEIDAEAAKIIKETSEEIKDIRSKGQAPAEQQRTDEGVGQQHSSVFSRKIADMIVRTTATIEEDKKSPFIATKGFQDAKEKLEKNRVVVIKGNSGDGKTTTAIRLILRLIEKQHNRQPLQLHNIDDLDSLPPKSKLITFIDDIFGEKVAHEKDVGAWNKRIRSVLPTLCGDPHTEANFLIVTIRNEVFNSLRSHTLENVFVDSNITDLSSNDYKIKGEMLELLESYKPEKVEFSWKENEQDEIIEYATGIGFPQCCRLFRDIPELQKERVEFFKNPFYFLERVLEKLAECNAILFLFLKGGEIDVKNLDPNGEKVDKKLLGEAFDIDLKDVEENRSTWNDKKKIEFVRKSLDTLSGFLVIKKKHWFRDGFVYKFAHDSIYATVERLYRQITPIGFVRYCPTKSLSLFTISKSASDSILLTPDKYVYMFERILREWESPINRNRELEPRILFEPRHDSHRTVCSLGVSTHGIVCSLDVWTDEKFIESFVRWLNDENIIKVNVLNKACHRGVKHVVLYLLSDGVKPNKDTDWWSLVGEHRVQDVDMDTLHKVIKYMNDEMKLGVLNKACSKGFVGCVLYLLSGGVKPDKDTDWWSLINVPFIPKFNMFTLQKVRMLTLQKEGMDTLQKVIKYMNDEMKLDVLNKACSKGFVECVLYLLSEGVKPDKDTNWWSLVTTYLGPYVNMDILKKVIKYINDEMRLDLLNKACCSSSDECVRYLLSEDVECEENTPFCVVKTENIDMLRNIVCDIDDETKRSMLNVTCYKRLEECALYLLSKGGKPDNNTPFFVVRWGSVNVLRELFKYNVIPTARSKWSKSSNKYVSMCHVSNINVLLEACLFERGKMVTLLCSAYPELVHDTDEFGHSLIVLVALTGKCGIFRTVERVILKTLYRDEDEQHQCESVDGRVVHRYCVCAQYMSQVLNIFGGTILNAIRKSGHSDLLLYLRQSYPELETVENNICNIDY